MIYPSPENIMQVLNEVAAVAGDRTDAFWSGYSQACEEIRYRLFTENACAQGSGENNSVNGPCDDPPFSEIAKIRKGAGY